MSENVITQNTQAIDQKDNTNLRVLVWQDMATLASVVFFVVVCAKLGYQEGISQALTNPNLWYAVLGSIALWLAANLPLGWTMNVSGKLEKNLSDLWQNVRMIMLVAILVPIFENGTSLFGQLLLSVI